MYHITNDFAVVSVLRKGVMIPMQKKTTKEESMRNK